MPCPDLNIFITFEYNPNSWPWGPAVFLLRVWSAASTSPGTQVPRWPTRPGFPRTFPVLEWKSRALGTPQCHTNLDSWLPYGGACKKCGILGFSSDLWTLIWILMRSFEFEEPWAPRPASHSDLTSLRCVVACAPGRAVSSEPAKSQGSEPV